MTSAQQCSDWFETWKWDTLLRCRACERGIKKKQKKNRQACSAMERNLLKVFPPSLVWLIERAGTRQCLALEHRGCANWTRGSVASVQINREAAQESSGAVRGIGEASHPAEHSHKCAHMKREHTQARRHKQNHTWTPIRGYASSTVWTAKEAGDVTWSYSEAPG